MDKICRTKLWKTVVAAKEELERGGEVGNVLDFFYSASEMQKNYCGNVIVNAILTEKEAECHKYGIELRRNLKLGEVPGIAKSHLCSIFTNLLDNAIAAVKELPGKNRVICLGAGSKAGYLVVKTKNASTEAFIHRKPAANHGMGKRILFDLAGKYDGFYEAEFKDGFYHATVIVKPGKKHYSLTETKQERLQKIEHDFRNRFAAVYSLAGSGQRETALDMLKEMEAELGEPAVENKM